MSKALGRIRIPAALLAGVLLIEPVLQGREAVRLVSGDSEGSAGGFKWHSRISPYEEAGSDTYRTRLYRIDVSVNWGEGAHQRSVRLSTLRIGQAP